MHATNNTRNALSLDEMKNRLCAEHAGRLFVAEAWWAIVPNKDNSFAATGDASGFWALVNATLELGQPLGFTKKENHLMRLVSVPHSDPELLLRQLIKVEPRAQRPVLEIVEARCKINGRDPAEQYKLAMDHYNEELAAEEARVDNVIKTIMRQMPVVGDNPFEVTTKLGAFNEETGEYDEYEVTLGEYLIPIDRAIEFGEKQLKFLANNDRVPDIIFGAENALWTAEIEGLKAIIQEELHEGAGEGSRALDERLLSSNDMQAGANAGK